MRSQESLKASRPQRPERGGCGGEAGLKLETLHWPLLLLKHKLALTLVHLWSQTGVLLLYTEVVFNQVESLLVDLLVLVALQKLDLVQACGADPQKDSSV